MVLKGKNILITGCNRGIGLETLKFLYSQGANLIACARKDSIELKEKIKKIELKKNTIDNFFFELTDKNDLNKNCNKILNKYKKIDSIVNIAGVNSNQLFLMSNIEDIKKNFENNFFCHLYLTQMFLKKMIKNKNGSIIFISSNITKNPMPGRLAYASSKSAIIMASKILAKELGPFNIRVNSISPGLTKTSMATDQLSEIEIKNISQKIGLRRLAEPVEIAKIISFLCSDESSYISGENIVVDGAFQ